MKNSDINKNIKTSLKFRTGHEKKGKSTKRLVVLFAVVMILVASVSLAVTLAENEFNLGNIGQTIGETTTDEITTQQESVVGKTNFLLVCTDDDSTVVRYAALLCADMNVHQLRLFMLELDRTCTANNFSGTLVQHYQHAGMPQLVRAVEQYTQVGIARYIMATDSSFKKAVKLFGGLQFDVPVTTVCELNGVTFTIDKGLQTLTPDMMMRYMIHLSQGGAADEKVLAQLLCAMIDSALSEESLENSEQLFRNLSNYVNTNISVVDFAAARTAIGAFIGSSERTPSVVTDSAQDF